MITISLFALLALALTLLVWVMCLLKHSREQEQFMYVLLERVEVQEELILHKTQEIKTLQEAVFETKESFIPWIESLQEESDEWADIAKDAKDELAIAQDCIWDKDRQVSELAEANQRVADTLLSLSYKEGPVTPLELTELREIALRWDQIPF